jgi:hypothetical protein
MPWTITFRHSERTDPVATFANVPDQAGDKILSFILPIIRAAESAAMAAKQAKADPYRGAIDALLAVVTSTTTKKKKGRRS